MDSTNTTPAARRPSFNVFKTLAREPERFWPDDCPDCGTRMEFAFAPKPHRVCPACAATVLDKKAEEKEPGREEQLCKIQPHNAAAAHLATTGFVALQGRAFPTMKPVPVPKTSTDDDDAWAEARRYARLAEGGAQITIVAQIMCGFELIELHKRCGISAKGGRPKKLPNDSEVLTWPELVKAQIGRTDDTARNWMGMARAVQPRLKKLAGPWEAPALLALPPSEWPAGARQSIADTLQHICRAKTQAEWMQELGLVAHRVKPSRPAAPRSVAKPSPQETPREDCDRAYETIEALGEKFHALDDAQAARLAGRLEAKAWEVRVWLNTPSAQRAPINFSEESL